MTKVFYVFDGNKVLENLVGVTKEFAERRRSELTKESKTDWLVNELVELDAKANTEDELETLSTIFLNNRPFAAFVNDGRKACEVFSELENDDYRRYSINQISL